MDPSSEGKQREQAMIIDLELKRLLFFFPCPYLSKLKICKQIKNKV
jgi:hypothetical protein